MSESEYEFDLDSDSDEPIEQKYEITTLDAVNRALDAIICRFMDVAALPRGTSTVLLDAYNYDVKRLSSEYLEDADATVRKIKLENAKDLPLLTCGVLKGKEAGKSKQTWICPICTETVALDSRVSLGCKHAVCIDCMNAHIQINMFDGGRLFSTRCAGDASCKLLVTREAIDPSMVSKFDTLLPKVYVKRRPHLYRGCPGADCKYIAQYIAPPVGSLNIKQTSSAVQCLCGTTFCFDCGLPVDHLSLPCTQAKRWLDQTSSEKLVSSYLSSNTKDCPNCKARIERDKGCNHMQCTVCGTDFCWVCSQLWSLHQGGSFYTCVRFRPNTTPSTDKHFDTSKKRNAYFRFYHLRYENHRDLAMQVGSPVEKDAHELLTWAYVLLYFLDNNSNIKVLLENLVVNLARDIEVFSPPVRQRTDSLRTFIMETDWTIDNKRTIESEY